MALINCPECEHQMSDTAKKCPHCGYRLNIAEINKIKNYSIGVGLGIIGLFVISISLPTMTNWGSLIIYDSEAFLIGCIMFVVGLGTLFVGCKVLKNVFRFSIPVFGVLAFISIASMIAMFLTLGIHSYRDIYSKYYNFNTESSMEATNQNHLGTYIYIQPKNHVHAEKLVITLNEDETAVAKATKEGKEETYYGSWSYYSSCDGYLLTFSDAYFTWGSRTTSLLDAWMGWADAINVDGSVIRDGYLYSNTDMAKAKNPEHRVKLNRTAKDAPSEVVDEAETEAVVCDSVAP